MFTSTPAVTSKVKKRQPEFENITSGIDVNLLVRKNSTDPEAGYSDIQLSGKGKFVENSTKLTCVEITSYRIKYSTVLWLIELQIRRGRKV